MKKIYFIGEVSGNHENSLEKTIKLMKGLKEIGASAVKFQTFKPSRMAPNLKNKDTIVKMLILHGMVNPCMKYIEEHSFQLVGTKKYFLMEKRLN